MKNLRISPSIRFCLIFTACLMLLALLGNGAPAQRTWRQLQVPADVELVPDVQFGMGGENPLTLDIIRPKNRPKQPLPVVVFVHGGGWQQGRKENGRPRLIPLAQRGYFTATINYRLSGEAIFPAQIEDCKCAIRFLRAKAKEYNIDPNRIGAWGSSAGGHLVALLGTSGGVKNLEGKGGWEQYSSRVQAVCDYFGPTDFMLYIEEMQKSGTDIEQLKKTYADNPISRLLGGPFWEKPGACRKASPITYVDQNDPPFLICHGDRDELVPLSQSEALEKAVKKAGVECTLHVVKGAAHGFQDPVVDRLVIEFFDKHLK